MHSPAEKLKFFREFLRSPRTIGSVVPTSGKVIKHIQASMDWSRASLVVEYGPGLGTITRPMLERMPPDAMLIAIDMQADFIEHLRSDIKDSRLIAVQGSAADVTAILDRHAGGSPADYVVSGLPFSTLPVGVGAQIVAATHKALAPDGSFLVYQYSSRVLPLLHACFASVAETKVWLNIPPCHVFEAQKATGDTLAPASNHGSSAFA
tara:strand:+ start:719 stop:1342 length:624 start_codon:yes stop_codon:yes gene_type:complete